MCFKGGTTTEPETANTSAARDRLSALALAVALFCVYAAGACRTIYVGDSGELVTAVHVLGVPHPTGYPLYVLLGKAWTELVRVGSIAFRMSLFSSACAALACALLFLLCRRLGTGVLAALTAALCLAFGPSFWGEANVQRVYALNALFLAGATLLACAWWRRRDLRSFGLTVFVAALGACNHTYMAVFAAAFVLSALATDAAFVLRPRALALAIGAALAGLLPYLYLPIAVRFHPPMVWGDPGSLGGFFDIVLRREFWSRAWVETPADALVVTADYAVSVARELAWAGALLALAGLVAALRERRAPVLLLLAAMLGNLVVMILHGARSDLFIWHRYYIPSYFVASLLVGIGADALLRRAPPLLRALPLAVPLFLLVSGWARFDRSRYRIAEDFSRQLLEAVPHGAIVEAADDNVLFVLLYLTLVEGYRHDVSVVVHGSVPLPPAARFDPRATPVYFTHNPTLEDPGLVAVPMGLAFRIWKVGLPIPALTPLPDELPGAADPSVPKDYLTQNLIGQYHFMQGVTFERRNWPRARRHLERAAAVAPNDDVLFYSLGLIYLRNGLYPEALAALEQSARINPRSLASAPGFRAADLIPKVRAEMERIAAVEVSLGGDAGGGAVPTAAEHLRLARLLEERGEAMAARGHRLRAEAE